MSDINITLRLGDCMDFMRTLDALIKRLIEAGASLRHSTYMTRLPDVSNQKINNAGAMALAKGDEMSEMKSIDGMSDLSKEVAKLSKFLTDHIEKFACAFAKETGLDPTKIKMVQQSLDNGFGYKVWFEPFPKESEIEMYRVRAERAEARIAELEALVERLMRMVEDRFVLLGNSLDGHLQDCNCAVFLSSRMERDAWSELCYEWHGIYSDWQSANGHQAGKVSENEGSEG